MITCSKVEDKKIVVEYFYKQEDEVWHKTVHKKKGLIEENIEDTLKSMDGCDLYLVKLSNEKAAFFGHYEESNNKVLSGFHIRKDLRRKDFILLFWKKVIEVFNSDFLTGIMEDNKEALNHLIRQGFTIKNKVLINEQNFFILQFKK